MSRRALRMSSSRAGGCASTVASMRYAPRRAEPSVRPGAVESLACLGAHPAPNDRGRVFERRGLMAFPPTMRRTILMMVSLATALTVVVSPADGALQRATTASPQADARRDRRLRWAYRRWWRRTDHPGHKPQRLRPWLDCVPRSRQRADASSASAWRAPSRSSQSSTSRIHTSPSPATWPRAGGPAPRPLDHRPHPRRHPPPPAGAPG